MLQVVAALLLMAAQSARADPFSDGLDQLRAGHFKQAAVHFRKAAQSGKLDAFFMLGVMHQTGQGVAKSARDAAILYRHIAHKGHARAQVKLGGIYAAGQGMKVDLVRAYMWFEIAASKGEATAIAARPQLAIKMKKQDLALARKKAITCLQSKYKTCD